MTTSVPVKSATMKPEKNTKKSKSNRMILAPHKDNRVSEEITNGSQTTSFAENYPLNILIAEDNMINQKLIERILHKLGYQTYTVSDGTQVLDSVKSKDYDVILMDVRMPEMDGYEATQMIRKMAIEQPYIIAMTANSLANDRDECLNIGMNDYISKPLQISEIIQILKNAAFRYSNRNLN